MKILTPNEITQSGRMILIYSETGVGKTTSILQSAPDPIAYIQTEPRSLRPSLDAAGREDLDIDIFIYEGFFDLMKSLSDLDKWDKYTTIAFDGYSHFMNIQLGQEIGEEKKDGKTDIKLSEEKITLPDRGIINTSVFRATNLLGKLSQRGKVIIGTALLYENPKWDRSLAAAPALGGREVPANIPGFFDLIGLVEPRVDEEGNIVYPPLVRFASADDSFVCKFTGKGRTQGPLDFGKLLKL